ncbi:hypothetical protein F511_06896 [Dorcoceras hygrometricum]|uniref:Uncharacterized protein n=1 Tax=Dorcoceras hygrometricum TaxID=472368 RepID=A0A2Z7CYG6_9LAMI|nr:hypothetical protein F511_06896 [Dorcoceras hygrometricum]
MPSRRGRCRTDRRSAEESRASDSDEGIQQNIPLHHRERHAEVEDVTRQIGEMDYHPNIPSLTSQGMSKRILKLMMNLQFMLDISNEMQYIELFIETVPIDRHVPVDDPESYIPCITQGFNALGFNSVGFNEDASTSVVAWNGATDQNRYTSDHDTGDWDQYVIPTLEENVSWPFSSARQWSFVDVDDEPLDIHGTHISAPRLTQFYVMLA